MHVAMQVKAVHLVMQPLDLGDFGVGDVFAGEAPGETFETAHDLEQFSEIVLAQLPHAGAAVRQQLNQSFGRQYLQRFTQRRARDAQHLAKLAFGHPTATRNVAFDDVVAQTGQDLVMQGQLFRGRDPCRPQPLSTSFHWESGVSWSEHRPRWDGSSRKKCKQFFELMTNYFECNIAGSNRADEESMSQHQGRHFLQIPGPSPVPDRVLRAMDMPVIDHRSPEFAEARQGGVRRAARRSSRRPDR